MSEISFVYITSSVAYQNLSLKLHDSMFCTFLLEISKNCFFETINKMLHIFLNQKIYSLINIKTDMKVSFLY